MKRNDVRGRLDAALARLVHDDGYLFANNLGERCIAARLAMHLQHEFPEHHVDAEYNRDGDIPKHLGLEDDCANYVDENGDSLVVPDIIVHRRGVEGPNILVLEVKKTTNPAPRECDSARIHAFCEQYDYEFAALIECETRAGHEPAAGVVEWLGD
jgi:hypothetical protein